MSGAIENRCMSRKRALKAAKSRKLELKVDVVRIVESSIQTLAGKVWGKSIIQG